MNEKWKWKREACKSKYSYHVVTRSKKLAFQGNNQQLNNVFIIVSKRCKI
jgi:hypothetical protein